MGHDAVSMLDPDETLPSAEPIRPGGRVVALLLATFAVIAAVYATLIGAGVLAFSAGTWVVGEETATRGWIAYAISALVHACAATGVWKQWRWARWLGIVVLVAGLLPAVPGISAAVVDLRAAGIALWGVLILLHAAALYVLFAAAQ